MSPDFTLLFFPQLLLALYPKRFSARAAEPAALAVEGCDFLLCTWNAPGQPLPLNSRR